VKPILQGATARHVLRSGDLGVESTVPAAVIATEIGAEHAITWTITTAMEMRTGMETD